MSAPHEVAWGNTRICYSITRSARTKTMAIRVEPSGQVEVVAPEAVPLQRIATLVRQKAAWIVERQRRVADVPPAPTARAYLSGESFLYLGKQYRLKMQRSAAEGVRLQGGFLVVSIPHQIPAETRADHARSLLIDWYRRHAADRLPAKVEAQCKDLGVTPTAILLREPKQRWGSCDSTGTLRLNWRIIQAAPKLIDYVIAHELTHLIHANHSADFWATLGRVMPDYEQRRDALRKVGAGLVW